MLPLILLSVVGTAGPLAAQRVPGEEPSPGPGWAPPSLGVRLGYDNKQRDQVLGGQVRLPVLPDGTVELMGSMDVTFLQNLKEYQYNLEGAYVLDGRAGGLYAGGGLGWRNTIYPDDVQRHTEMGFTALIGFRLVGLGLIVPQLEYRWVFIDAAPFTYQSLSLGVNLALWRPVAPR
jgi:hypothetical protein